MSQPDLYQKINRQLTWLALVANASGAFISFLFFSVIFPLPQTQIVQDVDWLSFGLFMGVTAVLLWIGFNIFRGTEENLRDWFYRLQAGASPQDVPVSVQVAVLNNSARSVLVTLGMWLLATLFTTATNDKNLFLHLFVGIFLVGGVLTAALTFFVGDWLWRPILPVFFPQGGISQIKSFRLPVFGRLLAVFLLVTVWPMAVLVILSLQRAQQLVAAPNPQLILNNLLVLEVFILVVSLAICVGMALFVTRGITGPIERLQAAMARVEKKDLQVQVPVSSNDELGYLEDHFNQMVAGLRRAELMRDLLNLYVTPEVAGEALAHGVQLGGRLVHCSVLFSDIRNFTGMSEAMPPERLIALLNRYMEVMVAAVADHGGMVNKFGGDSLLAVFGTPLNPAEDHAGRAIRAALRMLERLDDFNQVQREHGEPELRIGIGIATGEVVAGNVGGKERIEYTVIGDTVNLASRLQSLTKEMGRTLLVSDETYRSAAASVDLAWEALPPVHIRGKEDAVKVWSL